MLDEGLSILASLRSGEPFRVNRIEIVQLLRARRRLTKEFWSIVYMRNGVRDE
jgi:hypothetical protein